jgi:hypothetical protein
MKQTSPAKVKVKGINQVAIVVKDLKTVMEKLLEYFGHWPLGCYLLGSDTGL